MEKLELKVPPVALAILFGVAMWAVSIALPRQAFLQSTSAMLTLVFGISGILFPLLGFVEFRKSKTTVNPMSPGEASSLVTSGVYSKSRNPMYIGFLLILVALAFHLQSLYALVLCIGFVLYMNRFQIEPEERFLTELFPDTFPAYKSSVRRWI